MLKGNYTNGTVTSLQTGYCCLKEYLHRIAIFKDEPAEWEAIVVVVIFLIGKLNWLFTRANVHIKLV